MNGHYNHNLSHQRQGRNHDREWESATVNGGRAKSRMPAVPSSVPTLTQAGTDGKRDRTIDRRNTREQLVVSKQTLIDAKHTKVTSFRAMETNERSWSGRTLIPAAKGQPRNKNGPKQRPEPVRAAKMSFQNSAAGCYVGAGAANVCESAGGSVFGVYSETKYTFAVNGLPGNPAQASAAAAFFAR